MKMNLGWANVRQWHKFALQVCLCRGYDGFFYAQHGVLVFQEGDNLPLVIVYHGFGGYRYNSNPTGIE